MGIFAVEIIYEIPEQVGFLVPVLRLGRIKLEQITWEQEVYQTPHPQNKGSLCLLVSHHTLLFCISQNI